MATRRSAGLLMYRRGNPHLQVFLVHPGGPFWRKKDAGAWTIPKGEYREPEPALAAARREFQEETSFAAEGEFVPLGEVTQSSGKIVSAWAFEGDCDPAEVKSNFCEVEWPPRTGRTITIPEVDRGGWFSLEEARAKMFKAQLPFLARLEKALGSERGGLRRG